MRQVEASVELPNLAAEWMMGNVSTLIAELGDRWPDCAEDLTDAIEDGLRLSQSLYNLRMAAEAEAEAAGARDAAASVGCSKRSIWSSLPPTPARRSRPSSR